MYIYMCLQLLEGQYSDSSCTKLGHVELWLPHASCIVRVLSCVVESLWWLRWVCRAPFCRARLCTVARCRLLPCFDASDRTERLWRSGKAPALVPSIHARTCIYMGLHVPLFSAVQHHRSCVTASSDDMRRCVARSCTKQQLGWLCIWIMYAPWFRTKGCVFGIRITEKCTFWAE